MGNVRKHVFVIFAVLIFLTGETGAAKKDAKISSERARIIVYYFHGTYRCPSCTKIEKWSYEAIKHSFLKALKEGRLLWKPVNVDKPENRHFVKEYSLFTKSLIITEVKGEKQTKWKNLDKVWRLLRDQEKFSAYVTQEVKNYMDN
ncbi:MAG: nitrophenyl compound nitroreductase subunit ArsF family protein [Desulfobacterales bacterium]